MTISKTGILAEAIGRGKNVPYNKVELSDDFPTQNAFVNDTSRYIAVQCSRRSGKTTGLALKFFKAMESHPGSQSLYLSLTQDSARSILWPVLQEIDQQYKIGCNFVESKLEVTHPNGAKLKLMGADLKNFIKRLRGRKYPAVGIDEIQDMGPHVQSLIDDVLTPSISDYPDSWLAITGTPGPVPQGYFFDVTCANKYGYSVHGWTLLENPHMPNPAAFIDELKEKRGWEDNNPTLLREWKNQWVLDANSLWIRYNEKVNDYQSLPKDHKWNYVLGVDLGYRDADAICAIAWSDTHKHTFLVEEKLTPKQDITALVDQVADFEKRYKPVKIMMDEGALGKKIGEEIRRRHGIPVIAADKMRKQENVELLNDALRLGTFKAKANTRFVKDSYMVQIDWDRSTPNRIVIKKHPHSDIIDAVLYAFKESYAYTHVAEPEKPKWGTREWAEAQQNDMFEAEMAGLSKEESYSGWKNNDGFGDYEP